jgi:G3E family GTPase
MKDFGSWDDLTDRRLGLNEEDKRNIVDLLVDQVEFANGIIINKTDLISPHDLEQLNRILRQLNAKAKILNTTESHVDLAEILGTGLFSLSADESQPGWLAVPRGEEVTATDIKS